MFHIFRKMSSKKYNQNNLQYGYVSTISIGICIVLKKLFYVTGFYKKNGGIDIQNTP